MYPGLDKSILETNTCYQDGNGGSNLLWSVMEAVTINEGDEYRSTQVVSTPI